MLQRFICETDTPFQDDTLTLNTQIGSQWDGLRHWGFDDGRFYNGLTQAEICSGKTSRLGIHGECSPSLPPLKTHGGHYQSPIIYLSNPI